MNAKVLRSRTALATCFVVFGAMLTSGTALASDSTGSPASSTSFPTQIILTGAVPSFAAASGTIAVYAEPNMSSGVIGQSFQLTLAATATVSGQTFALPISNSSTLTSIAASNPGAVVNTIIAITNGISQTEQALPISLNQTSVSVSPNVNILKSRVSSDIPTLVVPNFPSPRHILTSVSKSLLRGGAGAHAIKPHLTIQGCSAVVYSTQNNQLTTVGQAHTASLSTKTTGVFTYQTGEENTFSVGASASGAIGSFSTDGTFSMFSSVSTGINIPGATSSWVQFPFDYDTYELLGKFCLLGIYEPYVVQPYAYQNTPTLKSGAPTNPAGKCPNGVGAVTVNPGVGTTTTNFGSTDIFNSVANVFGYSFGGSTSYTTSTTMVWTALSGGATTYLCGPGETNPNGQAIVYDSLT